MGRPRLYTPEQKVIRDKESCARYRARTREFQQRRWRTYRSNNKDAVNARNRDRHHLVTASLKKKRFDGSKVCRLCDVSKPLSDFWFHACASDLHRSECTLCLKAIRAEAYRRNRDTILARQRATYHLKIETHRKNDRKRRKANPELFRQRARVRFQKNKDVIRQSKLKRRHTDISYRVAMNMRGRLNTLLRRYKQRGRSAKKAEKTSVLLGCSFEDFVIYLESKFEIGMSWENYGKNGWHVDHIMPCAIFDLTKPEHQKRCFHFSNMQPMWAEENMSKNAKVLDAQFRLI